MFPDCLLHFNHRNVTRVEHTTSGSIRLKPLPILVFDVSVDDLGQDLWQFREKLGPYVVENIESVTNNQLVVGEKMLD